MASERQRAGRGAPAQRGHGNPTRKRACNRERMLLPSRSPLPSPRWHGFLLGRHRCRSSINAILRPFRAARRMWANRQDSSRKLTRVARHRKVASARHGNSKLNRALYNCKLANRPRLRRKMANSPCTGSRIIRAPLCSRRASRLRWRALFGAPLMQQQAGQPAQYAYEAQQSPHAQLWAQ